MTYHKYIVDNNYFFKGYPAVTVYKNSNALHADLIILCQHGYGKEDFIKHFPSLYSPFKANDSEYFSDFLEIEHDYGAEAVAFKISEILKDKLNVFVITVDCDRAIMDANRLESYCISPLVSRYFSEPVINELKELNFFIREVIISIFKEKLDPEGYIIDIHTMWPFNINVNYKDCHTIKKFVQEYLSPLNKGEPRNINLITHSKDGVWIADESLSTSVEQELGIKYTVKYNEPFCMLPVRSNYIYFSSYKGIAIDIPRNLIGISKSSIADDFTYMKKDNDSIISLSAALSKSVLNLFS